MTWWALFDRLLPVAVIIATGALCFRLGRAYERIDWLTGDKQTLPAPVSDRSGSTEATRRG